MAAEIVQLIRRLATGWTAMGSISGGTKGYSCRQIKTVHIGPEVQSGLVGLQGLGSDGLPPPTAVYRTG